MTEAEILQEIRNIFKAKWTTRDGRVVPDTNSLKAGNDAVAMSATVLYADLADSTGLVNAFKAHFAAEIYKAYLLGACRVVRNIGGEITAFDGDRLMAVFTGNSKNTDATKCGLQINYLVSQINKIMKETYPTTAYVIKQCVGIDTGDLFISKTGIRDANDLVWVGKAANYAAKLCSLREENYSTYITEAVFNSLADSSKFGGNPKRLMWENRTWTQTGMTIYRSNWWWNI